MEEEIFNLKKEVISFTIETMKAMDKKEPASVAAVAELIKATHSLLFII